MKKLRGVIAITICAALCVGYYFYLSHREAVRDAQPSEMETLMSKDLEKSYPQTAREVVRFHNRILRCLYNDEPDEKELTALVKQEQRLWDEELLLNNPEDLYIANLKEELAEYREAGKTIISETIASANEVEYKEVDGRECAYVYVTYAVKGEKDTERSAQTYILRKSPEGRWKILGFYSS